jgi:hypothetical protein
LDLAISFSGLHLGVIVIDRSLVHGEALDGIEGLLDSNRLVVASEDSIPKKHLTD